jgi:serine/threonine protein kinase
MIGTAVGSYRITAKIAEGGMGTVYRAEHAAIGRVAAIKILHPELSHNRSIVDRFFNEAKATSAIRHPGIVEVFDFGYLESGAAFLIMEFLQGEPLSRYLKRRGGRIPESEAAWLLRSMCSALAAAHAKNIVHRDLKPDNVFMVPDQEVPLGVRPKLLDFGIAKLSGSEISSSKTRTGSVLGTPTYMSPEQCKGTGDVDARADLYSLGCILYEMLCSRPPFVSEGAGELIGAHLFVAPDSPRVYAPQISVAMETMILRLLAKAREQRPRSANELGETLEHLARASGWMPVATPAYMPQLQTPAPPPAPSHMENTQPMSPNAIGPLTPVPGTPRPVRPSVQRMAEAATVMEPMVIPPSGPMQGPMQGVPQHAAVPPSGPHARPQDSWQQMPMQPMGMHPMGMPMPAAPMMTPAPMPTPPPHPTPPPKEAITTLSGSTAVRQTAAAGGRTRWPIAIIVILLFAAASAATTYLVVNRKDKEAGPAAGGGGTPTTEPQPQPQLPPAATTTTTETAPPTPTPTPAPPPTPPTPPPTTTETAPVTEPPTESEEPKKKKKKADGDRPGDVIDLGGEKPKKKRKPKPEEPKPPGPIETDI